MAEKLVSKVYKVLIRKHGGLFPMGSYPKSEIGEIVEQIVNDGNYSGKEVVVHKITTYETVVCPFKGYNLTE